MAGMLCMLTFAVVPHRFWNERFTQADEPDSVQGIDTAKAVTDSILKKLAPLDSLSIDSIVGDSLLLDSVRKVLADSSVASHKQLTVDSVLATFNEDSILNMLQAGRVLEVAPDSSKMDTVRRDTLKVSKSALDDPVQYTAKDSITFDYGRSIANLYGDSKINYQNLELQADYISMNTDSSIVHAMGRSDSTGTVKGKPVFKQGSDQYEPDSISYNFKSQKAFISNVYTEQGEGFLISKDSKRDSLGTMYLKGEIGRAHV